MNKKLFIKKRQYTNKKGVKITEYEPLKDLYIDSINPVTGDVERKKILSASKHENIKMYEIKDKNDRFEPFLLSEDHSVIAYDCVEDKIVLIRPVDLKEMPERYYLIQKNF